MPWPTIIRISSTSCAVAPPGPEAGGGLDEVRARQQRQLAATNFLLVGQHGAFEDDFAERAAGVAGFHHAANVLLDQIVVA